MAKRLEGKVAIVTGAASGMGREIARLFAKEGACVVATDVQEQLLEDVVKGIQADGGTALAMKQDVAKGEVWKEVVKTTIEKFGKIDILINNAGISMPKGFEDLTLADWQKVMAINVESIFHSCQLACANMKETGGGSIVNIASMASIVGNSGAGPYTASKGAVRAFSKALAVDMAQHKIRVNTIHPGYIRTEMSEGFYTNPGMLAFFEANTSLPYHGTPEDIAYASLYLASDEAAFVTGVDLIVDGGTTAK